MDIKIVPIINGFLAIDYFEGHPVAGRGQTPDEARTDLQRLREILERSRPS